ncbi:hypothetical protein M231_03179 [Tremella mesenterica]|uniref:LIM zinc-binding domain-containing protein n=1 Tax=Tremella mesenterica TaxID=5217 RepID=A0A4Q1BP05_TREME|nr:hypothetical protein M231_03179 [Tremella mesenterica]
MIVCNLCGNAVSLLNAPCPKCSGRGIEHASVIKRVLTPTQQAGSPDRWAQKYTTTPSPSRDLTVPDVPLVPSASIQSRPNLRQTHANSPLRNHSTIDISLDVHDSQLARVYGSVLDPRVQHPECKACSCQIKAGNKLYLAPRLISGINQGDVLCRGCYSTRFALGTCVTCQQVILGDKEEGSGGGHVKDGAGHLWHGNCFKCTRCSEPLYDRDHVLLPMLSPCCIECFDQQISTPEKSSKTTSSEIPQTGGRYARPGTVLAPKKMVPPAPTVSLNPERTPQQKSLVASIMRRFEDPDTSSGEGTIKPHPPPLPQTAYTRNVHSARPITSQSLLHDISRVRSSSPPLKVEDATFLSPNMSKPQRPTTEGLTGHIKPPGRPRSMLSCPGCLSSVALLDRGVVRGPHGQLWHQNCLKCGKGGVAMGLPLQSQGCGKVLDALATVDKEGHVWCRACSLSLQIPPKANTVTVSSQS